MVDLKLPFPSTDDPNALADWLEAELLLTGRRHASRTWLRRRLRGPIFPDEAAGAEGHGATDLEVALELLVAEVERRRRAGQQGYPFRADDAGSGVETDATTSHAAYVFMLLISVSPALRDESRQMEVDEPFDLITLEAIRSYLGGKCKLVRFGSPARHPRPTNFADAIPWLAQQLGLPTMRGPFRSHTGDGGVDVVAWLPFDDGRHAFLVLLAQCTVRRQWHKKGRDIVPDEWRGFIDFGKDPVSCLAVPFAVPLSYERWSELRRTTTVLLDRLRLARHAEKLPPDLQRILIAWSRKEAIALGAQANDLAWAG